MSLTEAQLSEIFTSIQGEGLYIGERQIFVRLAGCNLACRFCDTPQALTGGTATALEKMVESVEKLNKPEGVTHSISLTGGEPLLQADFLKAFIPIVKEKTKLPIYLETNGVLPEHLSEVIELIDITAFDIKLPSATDQSPYWKEHRQALEVAYLKEVFVKVVFTKETFIKDLDEAVKIIAEVDERIPLILQPVTPHGLVKHRPGLEEILAFQTLAKRKLKTVRVIPQIHKLLGII